MAVDYFGIMGATGSAMSPTQPGQINYADFSVYLFTQNGLSGSVTATAQTLGGDSAIALTDYGTTSASLTTTVNLGPGNNSAVFHIPIPYTGYSGASKGFHVVLSNPTGNIPIMSGSAAGMINYGPPNGGGGMGGTASISITPLDGSVVEGDTGTSQLRFVVSLSGNVTGGFDVAYSTMDGTAFGNAPYKNDYTPVNSSLHFTGTNGEQKIVSVNVLGDTIVERDETLLVNLGNVSNVPMGYTVTKTVSSATGTIIDFDTALVSIDDAGSINEGQEGAGHNASQQFVAHLSAEVQAYNDLPAPAIHYSVNNVTTESADLQDSQGGTMSLSSVSGYYSTLAFTHITSVNDNVTELDEDYEVRLTGVDSPSGRILLAGSDPTADERVGSATIANDDESKVVIIFSAANNYSNLLHDLYIPEASTTWTITVSLTNPVDVDVKVKYRTVDGTQSPLATPGDDYTSASGVLTFESGATVKPVTISLTPDGIVEGNEWFKFEAYEVTDQLGRDVQIFTDNNYRDIQILDDDYAELSISNVTMPEPSANAGYADMVFVLTLSKPVAVAVTVDVSTADGTAVKVYDYEETSQTITFLPGQTTKTFTVRIYHDNVAEPDAENFSVLLTNLSAGGLTGGSSPFVKTKTDANGNPLNGTGTIQD